MRLIEENVFTRKVTYELSNGQYIQLDSRAVAEFGAARMIREAGYGHLIPTERVAVMQHGRRVGTVPPTFDPFSIRSNTFLYDVRPGDFKREGDVWIASRTLGPGDLEAVPGFVWERIQPAAAAEQPCCEGVDPTIAESGDNKGG
jgi:hypothetical protein